MRLSPHERKNVDVIVKILEKMPTFKNLMIGDEPIN